MPNLHHLYLFNSPADTATNQPPPQPAASKQP
jgi:hypothetical protein